MARSEEVGSVAEVSAIPRGFVGSMDLGIEVGLVHDGAHDGRLWIGTAKRLGAQHD